MALTYKKRRFVAEYMALEFRNAKEAAIRAGYSKKTAMSIGSRLTKDPDVKLLIAESMEAALRKTEITAEGVVKELAAMGFANMLDYIQTTPDGYATIDLSALTRDQAAAIAELTIDEYKEGRGEKARDVKKVRFKLADKKAALELLGKHLGMFNDRVDVNHTGLAEIIITAVVNDEESKLKVVESSVSEDRALKAGT